MSRVTKIPPFPITRLHQTRIVHPLQEFIIDRFCIVAYAGQETGEVTREVLVHISYADMASRSRDSSAA